MKNKPQKKRGKNFCSVRGLISVTYLFLQSPVTVYGNHLVIDPVLPHCAHLIRVDAILSDTRTAAIKFC